MTDLSTRISQVHQALSAAEVAADRSGKVQLLAVSKTRPIADIAEAYQLDLRAFGENYVQEGVDKVIHFREQEDVSDIIWHFIGPIQSNKSRLVAEHFDWVHTIDRLKIAQRLNEQRPEILKPLNVLIQINISEQASKSGISLSELPEIAEKIEAMPNLSLRGLMCIPAPANDEKETQRLTREFDAMQSAFRDLQAVYQQVDTLSMGMSGDMALAINHGSTMVRIGTAIFGPRT